MTEIHCSSIVEELATIGITELSFRCLHPFQNYIQVVVMRSKFVYWAHKILTSWLYFVVFRRGKHYENPVKNNFDYSKQVALQQPPQYACGCLFLLSEVLKARPPLW